jgi:hypothetical protein
MTTEQKSARRKEILAQVRSGDLTPEEADELLGKL